jgi:hypothetical protein
VTERPSTGPGSQGYLLVAVGSQKYYDLAVAAAASLRLKDPSRQVALVHDGGIAPTDDWRAFFDHLRPIPTDPRYVGCMNKLRIFEQTPFELTHYVDADCLMLGGGIEGYWADHSDRSFSVWGFTRTNGHIVGRDVGRMLARFGAPFAVNFHIPNYFFRKDDVAAGIFARANAMFLEDPDVVSSLHKNRPGQYADEPFIGLAMGQAGIRACADYGGRRDLVITTWRGRRFDLDFDAGRARFEKGSRFIVPRWNLLARSWQKVDPIFVHFTKLAPKAEYRRLAAQLRERRLAEHRSAAAPA